jgi:hypothetical protein
MFEINLWSLIFKDIVDSSAAGLLVPEGIIRPVVSASALTWYIKYICYWNLDFLNNVIIIKTKVLLPHAYVHLTDFGYRLGPLVLLFTKLKIIWLSNISILSVIPETRRAH